MALSSNSHCRQCYANQKAHNVCLNVKRTRMPLNIIQNFRFVQYSNGCILVYVYISTTPVYLHARSEQPVASSPGSGPQEGVCNRCGQLGGRWVGKGVIIITCADTVPEKMPLQTSGGYVLGANFEMYIRNMLALLYGVLHALFLLQKHIIMLIKTAGYRPRHCPLVKGFKVGLNLTIIYTIWNQVFRRLQQGRFHLRIVPVSYAAVAALEHSRDYILPVRLHLYRTVQIYHRLSCSSMF